MKAAALALLLALAGSAPQRAAALESAALALPLLEPGSAPRLVVAQRSITRAWGPEDSSAAPLRIPEWRSEGLAVAGSALVPGAGQLYMGESGGALFFALAEAAGWTARLLWRSRSDQLFDEATAFAGPPGDSASAWSFERWEQATGGSSLELQRLYEADREAFYHRIGNDPAYAAGWRATGDARGEYRSTFDRSQRFERRARRAGEALWINHVVAAVDALRAARLHNLRLGAGSRLQLRSGWRDGSPTLRATLETRF